MQIGIIGSGNVGSAIGKALVLHKFDVLFYDISVKQLQKLGGYNTTTEFKELLSCKAVFICIPTEALPNGDCDMSIYQGVVQNLHDQKYDGLVIQMSTCPPLTASEMSKLIPNYVVCPSHYTMSKMEEDAIHPVRLLIGTSDGLTNPLIVNIFKDFDGPMFFVNYETAEITKYIENVLASTVISYWNEVFLICESLNKMGYRLDSDKISRIVNVAPCWRSVYRFHGKGYGGLCLPKDTVAFRNWCLSKLGKVHFFASATHMVNEYMKKHYGVNERHADYRV